MKDNIIKFFPFLPFDYIAVEEYLSQMLEQGYRLKWIRGNFAGFEKNAGKSIRYVADPYAVSSILNFRRFSKTRLDSYTENGWYFTGKARGCYVFQSDSDETERPNLDDNLKTKIIDSQLNFAAISFALIVFVFWKCLSSPAVVYAILLTNIYIILAAGLLFLAAYDIFYIFFLARQKARIGTANEDFSVKGAIKRGKINAFKNSVLLVLIIVAFILEIIKTPQAVVFALIPLSVIAAGTIIIKFVSKNIKEQLGKYLLPIVSVIALAFLLILPSAINGLKNLSAAPSAEKYAESPLPLLHVSDISASSLETSSVKENISILGENILYSETSGNGVRAFTNYSSMRNEFFAECIFNYLYKQAPVDYGEEFKLISINGYDTYALEKSRIYLTKIGKTVFLFNITGMPDNTDLGGIIGDLILTAPEIPDDGITQNGVVPIFGR